MNFIYLLTRLRVKYHLTEPEVRIISGNRKVNQVASRLTLRPNARGTTSRRGGLALYHAAKSAGMKGDEFGMPSKVAITLVFWHEQKHIFDGSLCWKLGLKHSPIDR